MTRIYHITTQAAWHAAQGSGEYRAESLDTQGFIHLSQAHQVLAVANALYRGQGGLVLLCVDTTKLRAPLKYEPPDATLPVPGTADTVSATAQPDLFPHLYGALNTEAVAAALPFPPAADGTFTMPPQS